MHRNSDRERRRIRTTKENHGDDFFLQNARKAGRATPTKFTSETGRKAAFRKHELERIRKAELLKEAQEDV